MKRERRLRGGRVGRPVHAQKHIHADGENE